MTPSCTSTMVTDDQQSNDGTSISFSVDLTSSDLTSTGNLDVYERGAGVQLPSTNEKIPTGI